MPNDIRLRRLEELVKQRASQAVLFELKDPRLGFLTVTRVKLARDLSHATIFWSIIGSAGEKSKSAHALEAGRGYVQSAVAGVMGTRVTPRLVFEYDPGPEKAQKMAGILNRLRAERGEDEDPGDGGSEE